MAGAAQIPVTRLFGRSPAGMNSTGESDMRNYYDVVRNEQDAILAPVLDKLLPVMVMSTFGKVPDDFDYVFQPIHNPTDEEIGNNIKWQSEAIYGAHDRGIISDQIALKEIRQFGDASGLFTNVTDEDINKASNEVVKPELEMPGLDEEDPKDPGTKEA
jgi:phage-related protein (TIGR01555 family)